jgi:hypothetical protein
VRAANITALTLYGRPEASQAGELYRLRIASLFEPLLVALADKIPPVRGWYDECHENATFESLIIKISLSQETQRCLPLFFVKSCAIHISLPSAFGCAALQKGQHTETASAIS